MALLLREQRARVAADRDRLDLIVAADAVDDLLILGPDHRAEHRVLAVEPRRRAVRDEELAAVRAGPRVRHREDAGLVVLEPADELVAELVARAAAAVAVRAAALDHEIGDHAVEREAVVV